MTPNICLHAEDGGLTAGLIELLTLENHADIVCIHGLIKVEYDRAYEAYY